MYLKEGAVTAKQIAQIPVVPEGGHLQAAPVVCSWLQHPVLAIFVLSQLHQVIPGHHVVVGFA